MSSRKPKSEGIVLKLIRLLTAFVFIFSSSVKGVDPVGTSYRVEDYLLVYGWDFLVPYALWLGVVVIVAEFIIGVSLLFRLKVRWGIAGLLAMMVIFTVITYFDALYNLVPDCGCFGDAVKMTNWQTFYKNIVLILLAFILFVNRRRMSGRMYPAAQWVSLMIFLIAFSGFVVYNYRHLPPVDFRDWKEGNNMRAEGTAEIKTYVVYKNIETGETREFLSPNYPWNDSLWMSQWTFVDQRIDDSGRTVKHGLMLVDLDGNDVTSDYIEAPGIQFLLVSYDLSLISKSGISQVQAVLKSIDHLNLPVLLVTSSDRSEIDSLIGILEVVPEVCQADDIELKAMIRSNPGLVLLKDGVVIKKWHHRDFPDENEISSITGQ